MRVLVCGGRDYSNHVELFSVLNEIHLVTPIDTVIHGGARGADYLAGQWAKQHKGVSVVVVPADWAKHGKSAGPRRNFEMVHNCSPDLVIAVKGGLGTQDCVNHAEAAGLKVIKVQQREGMCI